MWKPLPFNPRYEGFHPCMHRWLKENISKMPPKSVRYILKPTSKRTEYLALPLLRRHLTLYLLHSDILPPDKRDKILQILLDSGFTTEQLDKMKSDEKRRKEIMRLRAEAGPFDVFDDDGNIITGRRKKKKGKKARNKKKQKKIEKKSKKKKLKKVSKKTKSSKLKKQKKKTKKNKEEEYVGFKAGKAGQLGPGWPHNIGLQLMTLFWKLEETPPDEGFISRAQAYFTVQAEVLHKVINKGKEPQVSDANRCLNLTVWIAQNVIAPAQAIPEENVGKLLLLRGGELKVKKSKKKKNRKKEQSEENNDNKRKWSEDDYPKINPEKRKIRRSTLPELSSVHSQSSFKSFLTSEASFPSSDPESMDSSKVPLPRSIDEESLFLNSSKWYNPYNPEFIYDGPHIKPKDINFINENSELKWKLTNANMSPQLIYPNPVAIYCPELRPIIHSGDDKPIFSENGGWFIMSNLEFYNIETPNNINTASVQEQLKMICRLIKTMAHISKMNMTVFLELIAEICESIELSNQNETLTPEEQLIDDKRTIILEKLFIQFFGSKLRDYNTETPNYMRIICQRGAALIRHLYEYTAVELWKQQTHKEIEIIEEIEEEEEAEEGDDPADILKWEEWLQYLSKASNVANMWQKWLQDEIESGELPENKEYVIQLAKEWIHKGEKIRNEAQQFLGAAKLLKPIYHRPHLKISQENINFSDNDDDDWISEDIDA